LATYPEVALGNTKYHHHYNGISNTGLMLLFLDHGSRTNESDPSIFIIFPAISPINYTIEVGHLPRRGIRKQEISSPEQ
jgi:hypothetical protein